MLRNIIWDLDGTIFDTYPAICMAFKLGLNEFDHDLPLEEIDALARVTLDHCLEELSSRFELAPTELEAAFERHYRQARPEDQPLFPGVDAVCRHIVDGGGLNLLFTHRRSDSAARLLDTLGIAGYFTDVRSAEDGYARKPNPAGFLAIIADHHLEPRQTLAVGDRQLDIQAGQAAGVYTCLFRPQGEVFNADICVGDYAELLRLLQSPQPIST